MLAVALLPSLRDLERRAREGRAGLAPAVAALVGSRLLDGAPLPVIEEVAATAVSEHVPAGHVLLRQGDEANDVLVLAEGSVDVTVDGVWVNVVDAPGYGGEIGLLQRSARTATVSAASDCVVYRISGRDFLVALGGSSPVPLQTEMAARLRRSGTS